MFSVYVKNSIFGWCVVIWFLKVSNINIITLYYGIYSIVGMKTLNLHWFFFGHLGAAETIYEPKNNILSPC